MMYVFVGCKQGIAMFRNRHLPPCSQGAFSNPSPQPLIIMQVTLIREVFYVSETL